MAFSDSLNKKRERERKLFTRFLFSFLFFFLGWLAVGSRRPWPRRPRRRIFFFFRSDRVPDRHTPTAPSRRRPFVRSLPSGARAAGPRLDGRVVQGGRLKFSSLRRRGFEPHSSQFAPLFYFFFSVAARARPKIIFFFLIRGPGPNAGCVAQR